MLIELGHPHPVDGQVVTQMIMDDNLGYVVGTTGAEVERHMADIALRGATPHFGGNEAVADFVHALQTHPEIGMDVTWVAVEGGPEWAADFARFAGEYCRCPVGKPADVEDTHWTWNGNDRLAPGVHPSTAEV